MSNNDVVVLFSGGTDSTLTAALAAERYGKVHLVTYARFGLFSVTNPRVNVTKLKQKYGEDKFDHTIIDVDKLTEYIFYERYLRNLARHGFFLLSICGLCKLAMHVRTVVFCLENNLSQVCDGANQGMNLFPAQMAKVIVELKDMYAQFGIEYSNPVFHFEGPQDTGFADKLHFEKIFPEAEPAAGAGEKASCPTTGRRLFDLGLMPSENVKGTKLDRQMQPRCFQFILFNIFVKWYYLYNHSYEEYQEATVRLYRDKIYMLKQDLADYTARGRQSRFFRLVGGVRND